MYGPPLGIPRILSQDLVATQHENSFRGGIRIDDPPISRMDNDSFRHRREYAPVMLFGFEQREPSASLCRDVDKSAALLIAIVGEPTQTDIIPTCRSVLAVQFKCRPEYLTAGDEWPS